MKKCLRIFLFVLILLMLSAKAFCFPAEVQDISGSKYFPAVKEAIANAQESVKWVEFKKNSV